LRTRGEEKYDYLETQQVEAFVKYNHLEQKKSFKKIFRVENFPYDEERDEFICPADRRLEFIYIRPYTDCSYKTQCAKSEGNRQIRVSFRLK
jgi:hypothetical protein